MKMMTMIDGEKEYLTQLEDELDRNQEQDFKILVIH
jgi:hypothetical protein